MTYSRWQTTKSFVGNFFWETWELFFASVVLTILAFFLEYGRALLAIIDARGNIPKGFSEKLLSESVRDGLGYIDQIPYMDLISVALFWMIIAIGLYIIYSFIGSLVEPTKEQIFVDSLSQFGFIKAMFVHFGEKIIAIIVFFVVIILGFSVLIEYWFQCINMYFLSGFSFDTLWALVVGLIGLCMTFYVVLVAGYITWFYERKVIA